MTVLPGQTICLRCLLPEGVPDDLATCDSVGVLMPVVTVVGALQAMECLKLLSGNRAAASRQLTVLSMWDNRLRQVDLGTRREGGEIRCPHAAGAMVQQPAGQGPAPAAGGPDDWLVTPLCGRQAVQVDSGRPAPVDLQRLGEVLSRRHQVHRTPFSLRLEYGGLQITVFADGRGLVDGTEDAATAREAFVGSIWPALQSL
jgi:adenylyltransferase/sulfurtransferase